MKDNNWRFADNPMSPFNFRSRIVFFLERQFIKGPQYQLLAVLAFLGLLSLLGGALLWPVAEADESFGDAVWWAFLRLSDPGYLGDDEGIWRRMVSTFFTIAGYVVFLGSLVAIITTWLNRRIRYLEQGLSPVRFENHMVVLGWTNRTLPIVAELFLSEGRVRRFLRLRGSRRLQVVILAEDVSPDIVQQIKDHPFLARELDHIILRSGQPIDYDHLLRVNAPEAAAIIVPTDTRSAQALLSPDVRTLKALLTLQEQTAEQEEFDRPYVVVELQDENKRSAAREAYNGPMEIISSDAAVGRLVAQVVRHPKLSWVYHQLLSQNTFSNIFVRPIPEGPYRNIRACRRALSRAIIMGRVSNNGTEDIIEFNMSDDTQLHPNDRLILMARSADEAAEWGTKHTIRQAQGATDSPVMPKVDPPVKSSDQEVLILGWNDYIPQFIRSLSRDKSRKYTIHNVASRSIEERKEEIEYILPKTAGMELNYTNDDFVRLMEREQLNVEKYDKILLAGTERLSSQEEKDARTLVGLAVLTQALSNKSTKPQIIVQLADPANGPLLERYQTDMIISPVVLSHLMAQVALRPELFAIYEELFSVTGAEIALHPLTASEIKPGTYKYRTLRKQSLPQGGTLLGILTGSNYATKHPSFWVPRSSEDEISVRANHMLVVLQT